MYFHPERFIPQTVQTVRTSSATNAHKAIAAPISIIIESGLMLKDVIASNAVENIFPGEYLLLPAVRRLRA